MLDNHPELWVKSKLLDYRGSVSESTFRRSYDLGNGKNATENINDATIDNNSFTDVLVKAGLTEMLTAKKGEEGWKSLIDLREKYKNGLDALARNSNTKLTQDQKDAYLKKLVKPVVVKAVNGWWGDNTMGKKVYEVDNPQNIIIPESYKARIIKDYAQRNIKPTSKQVLDKYLLMNEDDLKL